MGLDNDNGTAPGLILEKDGKTAILLPGPPNELIPMFEESVFPYLRKKQPEIICSQVVKICGIGESQVAADIQDMIEAQTNPTLAPYAKTGEVHLRITAKGEDEKEYDEHVWLSLRNAETLTQTIADALCERMLPTRLSIRKTQQTILPSCLNWTTNIRMLLQTLNAQRFCSPTAWSSAIFLNRNCFRLLQISSDCFTMYSGNISSRGGTLSGFLIFILPPRGNFLILWGCLLSDWMSL